MHSVFFAMKRAHLSTLKFSREVLSKVLTPARYDLVFFLNERGGMLTQRELRKAFGVARSTMSEAIRSLVRLGLVARERALDGRTFFVQLTGHGRAVLDHAMRTTRRRVKLALAQLFDHGDRLMQMHDAIDRSAKVRQVFGDTAVPELKWLWHPDN